MNTKRLCMLFALLLITTTVFAQTPTVNQLGVSYEELNTTNNLIYVNQVGELLVPNPEHPDQFGLWVATNQWLNQPGNTAALT